MNNMKKPKIRFKGFTDDWEQRKLGDIVERITRKNENLESILPLTISAQYGLIDQNEFFDKRIASKDVSGYYLVRKGEFAYNKSTSSDAPWGAIKRLDRYESGVLSTLYIVFRILDEEKIDSDYLVTYYDTDLWHKGVQAIAAEGARNHGLLNIAPADFFETTVSMPQDIEEQRKIGAYFKNLDCLITLHQRKHEKLQIIKKSMLENCFPKNGEKVPKIRFSGFTGDWEQRKVSDLAEKTYGGGTPTTSNEAYWNGDIPWIQSSDVVDGKLLGVKPRKWITQDGLNNSAAQLIPGNSIAIITRVGVGKLAFMPYSYATSQDFLSLSKLNAEPLFTVYALYKKLQSELNAVQGTSIKGITKDELLAKNIMVPQYAEQQQIGAFFKQLDHLITLHQSELEKLQKIKKSLLERMFV
jgi:type I restriction enzyme S subunit